MATAVIRRALVVVGLLVALAAGMIDDQAVRREPLMLDGFEVLQVDFHTHSSTWSDGALTPFGLVHEARARGLDAFAITGHDQTLDAKVGQWYSRLIGGPIVLRGEEVLWPTHHIIAAGIVDTIDFSPNAAEVIDKIHQQGGVAIAAHPNPPTNEYDARAIASLDGAEICHPVGHIAPDVQREFERFRTRGKFAAIGSSDFHGLGPMGSCRTYVFVRDRTERGIVEAVRERRTVVYGPEGRVYGDPELIKLAAGDRRLGESLPPRSRSVAAWVSGVFALVAFALLLTWGPRQSAPAENV